MAHQLLKLYGGDTFNPLTISGLQAWYSARYPGSLYQDSAQTTAAASNGDPVGGWQDLSGNGRHVTQATSSKRPTLSLSAQNGQAGIVFDGVDDTMASSAFNLSDGSVFVVYKPIALTSAFSTALSLNKNTGMIGIRETSKWYDYTLSGALVESTGTAAVGSTVLISATSTTANSKLYVNGSVKATDTSATPPSKTNGIALATNGTMWWNVMIAEILVYNSAFSDSQRQRIERSLGNLYGITVS
jgi:hypothetical protein